MHSRTRPASVDFATVVDAGDRPRTDVAPLQTLCMACGASGWCAPCKRVPPVRSANPGETFNRHRLAKNHVLYAQGDSFQNVYAVRNGTFKSTVVPANGREKICAFHTAGEIVGLDGMSTGAHTTTVTALEDAQVCVIAYADLYAVSGGDRDFQRRLSRLMSLEIVRGQRMLMQLGACSARQRLAAFVIDMSCRFHSQGYSARDFNLRMTRNEIASYLGLTSETVSRMFAQFQRDGLLRVDNRRVRIQDPERFLREPQRQDEARGVGCSRQ